MTNKKAAFFGMGIGTLVGLIVRCVLEKLGG